MTTDTPHTPETPPGVPTERPTICCPNCRQRNPIIDYGELAYYEQPFSSEEGDWTSDGGALVGDTDGSATIIAKCGNCEYDLTNYLLRWSEKHPDDPPYAHFVHELSIPRNVPLKRTLSRDKHVILRLSDRDIDGMIADHARALGELLDEREARAEQQRKEQRRNG